MVAGMVSRGAALVGLNGILPLSEKFVHQDVVKRGGYFSVYIYVSFKGHILYIHVFF